MKSFNRQNKSYTLLRNTYFWILCKILFILQTGPLHINIDEDRGQNVAVSPKRTSEKQNSCNKFNQKSLRKSEKNSKSKNL